MKHLKEALLGLAILVGLLILISIVHHYQLKATVERFNVQLIAAGAVTELSDALPPLPAPGSDGTPIFRQATELLEKNGNTNFNPMGGYFPARQMVLPGKAFAMFQQPDIRTKYSTNSWEELQTIVDSAAGSVRLFEQLPDHPEFNFQFHYGLGWKGYTNSSDLKWIQLKAAERCLNDAVLEDLHQGDTKKATQDELADLTLLNAAQSQNLLIAEMIGVINFKEAVNGLWAILQDTNINDTELASLQQNLQQINFLKAHASAVAMENIDSQIDLQTFRSSQTELRSFLDFFDKALASLRDTEAPPSIFNRIKLSIDMFQWRYWSSYHDELAYQQGLKILLDTIRTASTNDNFLAAKEYQRASLEKIGVHPSDDILQVVLDRDFRHLLTSSLTIYESSFRKVVTAETTRRIAITAIALKRYELEHKKYPTQLTELIPDFLPTVILDPMNGLPLHYQRQPNAAYLLYSVGENGVDDDGDSSKTNNATDDSLDWLNVHARDWVWPQVASPAEVQNFREHPPK